MSPKEYQERMYSIFYNLKNNLPDSRTPRSITVVESGAITAWLEPVTIRDLDSEESIRLFSEWREKHNWWFPAQFQVTKAGTERWLKAGLLDKPDRMLFWVVVPNDGDGRKIGHLGFFRINPEDYSCEADNIVRGEDAAKGVMTDALKALTAWAFSILGNRALELTVYEDNPRALALYDRCGFKTIKKIPLKRVSEPGIVRWEELPECSLPAERYFLKMRVEQ